MISQSAIKLRRDTELIWQTLPYFALGENIYKMKTHPAGRHASPVPTLVECNIYSCGGELHANTQQEEEAFEYGVLADADDWIN